MTSSIPVVELSRVRLAAALVTTWPNLATKSGDREGTAQGPAAQGPAPGFTASLVVGLEVFGLNGPVDHFQAPCIAQLAEVSFFMFFLSFLGSWHLIGNGQSFALNRVLKDYPRLAVSLVVAFWVVGLNGPVSHLQAPCMAQSPEIVSFMISPVIFGVLAPLWRSKLRRKRVLVTSKDSTNQRTSGRRRVISLLSPFLRPTGFGQRAPLRFSSVLIIMVLRP